MHFAHQDSRDGDFTFQIVTSEKPYSYIEFRVSAVGVSLEEHGDVNKVYFNKPWW